MKYLREAAEAYLNNDVGGKSNYAGYHRDKNDTSVGTSDHVSVDRVVVGVPATYTEKQKISTRVAAKLAGFKEVFKGVISAFLTTIFKYNCFSLKNSLYLLQSVVCILPALSDPFDG